MPSPRRLAPVWVLALQLILLPATSAFSQDEGRPNHNQADDTRRDDRRDQTQTDDNERRANDVAKTADRKTFYSQTGEFHDVEALKRATATDSGRSTGRTTPANEKETRAMEIAKGNPEGGRVIIENMNDSDWHQSDGWVKKAQNIDGVEIHYNYNKLTHQTADWKFK